LIAIVAAIVALAGSGDGKDGDATATTVGERKTAPRQAEKPEPKALARSELIAQGDAICDASRETYRDYRGEFPSGESEPSVGYSRLLVGISTKAVRRFNALVPPPVLRQPYTSYVRAQEEVAKWDKAALVAAEDEDEAAYLAAREDRDETEPERQQLAEAVGFTVCSNSQL
jgi:hypothetical protein